MTDKKLLNYHFSLKNNFWETEIRIKEKPISLSIQDTLIDDAILITKISKIVSENNVEVVSKKSLVTLTCLANQVYDLYGKVECDFELVGIKLNIGNIIEYQYYLYLKNFGEGDNYGLWTTTFEGDIITGVYRKQF